MTNTPAQEGVKPQKIDSGKFGHRYMCPLCKRSKFTFRKATPHKCVGGFRKRLPRPIPLPPDNYPND